MDTGTQARLAGQVEAAAKAAGLVVVSSEVGAGFFGESDDAFHAGAGGGSGEDAGAGAERQVRFQPGGVAGVRWAYLAETAKRLKNPRPECYLTLHGLPLSFGKFTWPFHAFDLGGGYVPGAWRGAAGGSARIARCTRRSRRR